MPENNNEISKEIEKSTARNKALPDNLTEAEQAAAPTAMQIEGADSATSEKIFRILIENMHEGAVTINRDGIVLYCNSCFADMLSQPLERVLGGRFEDFVDEISKENIKNLFIKGWDGYFRDEIHLIGNKSIVMPVLLCATTFRLNEEELLGIILTDVTNRNRSEMELKQQAQKLQEKIAELRVANKELLFQSNEKKKQTAELKSANSDVKALEELIAHKETILAILSHDLRSPLAGIIGMSGYLKANFQEMEQGEIEEMLILLEEASKNELNMLDYLVEWARIKYASEVFSPKKINLVPYVSKVFEILTDSANQKSIELINEISEEITVFADEKMLHSILQNLISNAIKHSNPSGQIHTFAEKKDNEIILEVRDNGMGMSKIIIDKLFTPQMDTLSKERDEDKGAGIGLLLVKSFLEKNGGRIWAESTEGKGSSFYFTLPFA